MVDFSHASGEAHKALRSLTRMDNAIDLFESAEVE